MNHQIRPQDIEPAKDDKALPTGDAPPAQGIILTPEQLRSRRARNIAIGLAIGFFALLFYAITIAKLVHFGPGFLNDTM